ncbi:MAG: mechanosensitive ion channel family protein [Pirellulales bacterium]|nr:mechanosensitive ion channel family protein [Pirellulales bacterium]
MPPETRAKVLIAEDASELEKPVREWFGELGLTDFQSGLAIWAIYLVCILLTALLADLITRKVLVRWIKRFGDRSGLDLTEFVKQRAFLRLAHIAPALVIWAFAPRVLVEYPGIAALVRRTVEIYILFVCLLAINGILTAFETQYRMRSTARRVPITGIVQVIKLALTLAALLIALSILLDKSPWVFLTGMGAATAVVMLVFKDTILGFVAGIQLAANDMVRPGDWIEMPKYGADGDVTEVALTTVKVRNFDNTITTVPTYALISDSFKNWRGMTEKGGRRIKRSVYIDVTSIKFCTPEMIERFHRIEKLRPYIEGKQDELDKYNEEHGVDASVLVNGRRMTNIGTFRAYVVSYLHDHPKLHEDMTLMVRQLPPTEVGLPLEIYVFTNDVRWVNYENIQSDIFDHIFAAVRHFDLRVFQGPTGADIADSIDRATATKNPLLPGEGGGAAVG